MSTTAYHNQIRRAKRHLRQARATRRLAYHLDSGLHGEAAPTATPGWWRWYPHPSHAGWLVEAAGLVVQP